MCYLNLCYIQRTQFLEAEIQDLYLSNLRWQKYSMNGMKQLEDEAQETVENKFVKTLSCERYWVERYPQKFLSTQNFRE